MYGKNILRVGPIYVCMYVLYVCMYECVPCWLNASACRACWCHARKMVLVLSLSMAAEALAYSTSKSVNKQSHPVSQHLLSDIYVDSKLTKGMCMWMVRYDKILCNRLCTTSTFTYRKWEDLNDKLQISSIKVSERYISVLDVPRRVSIIIIKKRYSWVS